MSMKQNERKQVRLTPERWKEMMRVKAETGKDLQVQADEALDAYLLGISGGGEGNKLNINENNDQGIDYDKIKYQNKVLHTLASEILKSAGAILEIASGKETPDIGQVAAVPEVREEEERSAELEQIRTDSAGLHSRTGEIERRAEETEQDDAEPHEAAS